MARVAVDFWFGQGAREAAGSEAILPERGDAAQAKSSANLRAGGTWAVCRRCSSVTGLMEPAPSSRHRQPAQATLARAMPIFQQAPSRPVPMLRTIRAHLDHRAATQPDRVFLIAPETGAILTYGDLQCHARALTAQLLALGVRPGEKVSLMMCNGYQTGALLLGIMYGGFTVAPINLLSQASQLRYVLEHSDTRVVFAHAAEMSRLREAIAAIGRDITILEIDVDSTALPPADPLSAEQLSPVTPPDDALLMYTSGTTGQPKGVLLSHQNVVAGGEYTSAAHALTESDRVLCVLPLYHINGQIVTAVAPLVSGGSVVLPRKFSATNYWQTAGEHGCTWLNFVPTIVSYLLNAPGPLARGVKVSSVRFARSASAPLPPELHRAFEDKFGIGIIETMGMTETAAPCFTNPLDPASKVWEVSDGPTERAVELGGKKEGKE